MKPVLPPDLHFVRAAEGWLELGNPAEAQAELGQVSPEFRSHPAVLDVQWGVFAAGQEWSQAHAVGEIMVGLHPGWVAGWIHRAYAARRMPGGGLETALGALRPAAERFPDQPMVPFNLACYLAQIGSLDEAWEWYQEAIRRGPAAQVRAQALDDEDLRPLWPRIHAGG